MLRTDQRNCTSLKNTIRVDKIRTIPMTKPIKQIRSYISRIIDRWNLVPVKSITRNSGISDNAKFINDENTTIELGPKTTLTIYDVEDNAENTNNNSVVCLLQHGQNKFFMSGDLEKDAEVKLRKEIGNVDVVVLSHHGSDTSNTNLDVLKPKLALASCSKDNEYGHINKETLERALKYSGRVFATYKSKTMILTSDGQKIEYNMDDKERLGEDDYGTVKVEGGN